MQKLFMRLMVLACVVGLAVYAAALGCGTESTTEDGGAGGDAGAASDTGTTGDADAGSDTKDGGDLLADEGASDDEDTGTTDSGIVGDGGEGDGGHQGDASFDPAQCISGCTRQFQPRPGMVFKELVVVGPQIAWVEGNDALGNVFFFDGSQITQISQGNVWDYLLDANASTLTWVRSGGFGEDADQLFSFSNGLGKEIGSNLGTIQAPDIDQEGNIAWSNGHWDDSSSEVYLFDGQQLHRLTINAFYERTPRIDQGSVVWAGVARDGAGDDRLRYEIFLYQNGVAQQITDNSLYDDYPRVSGGKVVWERYGFDGTSFTSWDICLYDGSAERCITDGNRYIDSSSISFDGTWIAWSGCASNDTTGQTCELYLYDTAQASLTQLTADNQLDERPVVDSGVVAWQQRKNNDPLDYSSADVFLFFSVLGRTIRLTDNQTPDVSPRLGHGWVGWIGSHAQADDTIFLATTECIASCIR